MVLGVLETADMLRDASMMLLPGAVNTVAVLAPAVPPRVQFWLKPVAVFPVGARQLAPCTDSAAVSGKLVPVTLNTVVTPIIAICGVTLDTVGRATDVFGCGVFVDPSEPAPLGLPPQANNIADSTSIATRNHSKFCFKLICRLDIRRTRVMMKYRESVCRFDANSIIFGAARNGA